MGLFNFFKKKKDNFEDFPPIGGLMVSQMITRDGKKPRFMYREKRQNPDNSGWKIFAGLESDEFANNLDNVGIYCPQDILKIDSSIASLLLKGVGSVFERKSETSAWYRVFDFELDGDYLVQHRLTDEWSLEINNLFERTKEEDGDLVYTTGDKTLRIAVWSMEGKSKKEIYEEHKNDILNRNQMHSKTLKIYELSDENIARIGYMIEENDDMKRYKVLCGFSISDKEVLQLAFYMDNDEDLDWAIDTWKKIVRG